MILLKLGVKTTVILHRIGSGLAKFKRITRSRDLPKKGTWLEQDWGPGQSQSMLSSTKSYEQNIDIGCSIFRKLKLLGSSMDDSPGGKQCQPGQVESHRRLRSREFRVYRIFNFLERMRSAVQEKAHRENPSSQTMSSTGRTSSSFQVLRIALNPTLL